MYAWLRTGAYRATDACAIIDACHSMRRLAPFLVDKREFIEHMETHQDVRITRPAISAFHASLYQNRFTKRIKGDPAQMRYYARRFGSPARN